MGQRCGAPIALLLLALGHPGCGPRHAADSAAAAAKPPLFSDVSAEVGIRFHQSNGASGKLYFIESTPPGGALFDYDNDGWLDILLVQPGPSDPPHTVKDRPRFGLFHNKGNGTFTDVTVGSGLDTDLGYAQGVAAGDYDNDGFEDLFITSFTRNYLFQNQRGNGRFKDVSVERGLALRHSTGYSTSAAFGDYNNDGRLDLYVCYYCPWTRETDKVCKNATGERDYCSPEVYEPEVHQLFRNDGDRFTDVSLAAGITKTKGRGLAVAFVDYDEDGRQDIFVANDLSANMLWRNNGDGTFSDRAQEAGCAFAEGGQNMAAMGIALADYDRTGHQSFFVTNFSGQPNTLFKNVGSGMFQDVALSSGLALPHMPFLAFGCEFMDYDNDGWPDLLVANGHVQKTASSKLEGTTYRQRKQLFRNDGTGKFDEITGPELGDLAKQVVSRGLAVGDLDNDGRVDALACNQNDPAQVFRNRARNLNNWVSFKTIGRKSNRDGRHARVEIDAGGARQTAVVRAGSSYLSVSDRRVHFGLGSSNTLDRVEVRWPSGARDSLKELPANRIYVITEERGITGQEPVKNSH